MAPRFVWRRVLAFLIDKTLAWAILGLGVASLGLSDPFDTLLVQPERHMSVMISLEPFDTGFRPFLALGTTTRGSPTAKAQGKTAIFSDGEIIATKLCIRRIFGVFDAANFDVTLIRADGTSHAESSPLLMDMGKYDTIPGPTAALTLVLLGWLGLAITDLTPGKWMMGLRVRGSFTAKLGREVVKLSPILMSFVIPLAISMANRRFPELFTT